MKIPKLSVKHIEVALIAFVWLVLIITPVLFREDIYSPVKRSVIIQFEILLPLSLLFVLNHFVFVPKFLFRGKVLRFFISVSGIIILFTLASFIYDVSLKPEPPPNLLQADKQVMLPPYAFPGGVDPFGNLRPELPHQPRPIPPFANFLILSILLVGFDTGLRSGIRWIKAENEKVRLEKENVDTKLVLLKNQISPHFFMNTLNNIHSLVDINTEEAKEAIIKLSKMMRYLLYETESEQTTLAREVEFIDNFINLMRLRFNEKVKISLNLPVNIPEKKLPPFLFISLIENAFKHGVSYKDESFIGIDLILEEERIILIVKNSKTDSNFNSEFSGIGIDNTRKRLDLIYGDRYQLHIENGINEFMVNLAIPV